MKGIGKIEQFLLHLINKERGNGMVPGLITVDGAQYCFGGNWRKEGKAPLLYIQNQIGLRFIIKSPAYDRGNKLPDGVAIYVHKDDIMTEEYLKWHDKTLGPVINSTLNSKS